LKAYKYNNKYELIININEKIKKAEENCKGKESQNLKGDFLEKMYQKTVISSKYQKSRVAIKEALQKCWK
jgi:hypothetical protein